MDMMDISRGSFFKVQNTILFLGHFYDSAQDNELDQQHPSHHHHESPPESALVTSTKPVGGGGCVAPPKKCIKLEAERIAAMVSWKLYSCNFECSS